MTSLLEMIDERAEDLTMTWKQIGVNPQPLATSEKIHQALFELSWIREKVIEIVNKADNIRLADVDCDADEMRDQILALIGQPEQT